MANPISVFPSSGYKNDQFQVFANVDYYRLYLLFEGKIERTLTANAHHPIVLVDLDKPGKYCVAGHVDNEYVEQCFEVKDAIRLGNSLLKKTYVFDDLDISFFLMNDRLLIHKHVTDVVLTENDTSPSEIIQLDATHVLFVTRIGTRNEGIINFGLFDCSNLRMVGELFNCAQDSLILSSQNLIWVMDRKAGQLICYNIQNNGGEPFKEVFKLANVHSIYHKEASNIFIAGNENGCTVVNAITFASGFAPRTDLYALDYNGFIYEKRDSNIICSNPALGYNSAIELTTLLNLRSHEFSFIGKGLQVETNLPDHYRGWVKVLEDLRLQLPPDGTDIYIPLPEIEIHTTQYYKHQLYPTKDGLLLITEDCKFQLLGYTCKKSSSARWGISPHTATISIFSIDFLSGSNSGQIIDSTESISILGYDNLTLLVRTTEGQFAILGSRAYPFEIGTEFLYHETGNNQYLLATLSDYSTLFKFPDLDKPLLSNVTVHNYKQLKKHNSIWFASKPKPTPGRDYNRMGCLSLATSEMVNFNEKMAQHSLFKDSSEFMIKDEYLMSGNEMLVVPDDGTITNAVPGVILAVSKRLGKIISRRDEVLLLSIFMPEINGYLTKEIPLGTDNYKEAYLSPDGKFLALGKETGEYLWYDINKNEVIRFFSGNFLGFTKEGNVIVEENAVRAVKIYDAVTFCDITPPNYHHYKFLSPDGKLYCQVVMKVKCYNRITKLELSVMLVTQWRNNLDDPKDETRKPIVSKNRQDLFDKHPEYFKALEIDDPQKINSGHIIQIVRFTEIGIVGTSILQKISFPDDLAFYNYAAFSHDNLYFGYVGKPDYQGIIHLYQIHFDEKNQTLSIGSEFITYAPRKAVWVCGFSRTGYFGTYDSRPTTYLLKCDDTLFKKKEALPEVYKSHKNNLYTVERLWNEIPDTNFLCFSPSGNFLALSEQGYDPLTLGGYGHQESNAVHIALTETGQVMDSYLGHGAEIKSDIDKKVTFVAFSEDESKIMSMSADGVVVVRNIVLEHPIIPVKSLERSDAL